MTSFKLSTTLLSSLLLSNISYANDKTTEYQQSIKELTGQDIQVSSVKDSPVEGIKELILANGPIRQIVYLSEDGEHLFDGKLMNIKAKQNLTELANNSMRHELLESFKKNHKTIDFLPQAMRQHITVFTDIDCGYCRKLHEEVSEFNDLGIGVSYLFFPRSGLNTQSHQKAVNVWCATDQQQAMTIAKSGQDLPPLMCPNPLTDQFNLGLSMGIHELGTPTILLNDGSVLRGYIPAAKMKEKLNSMK